MVANVDVSKWYFDQKNTDAKSGAIELCVNINSFCGNAKQRTAEGENSISCMYVIVGRNITMYKNTIMRTINNVRVGKLTKFQRSRSSVVF